MNLNKGTKVVFGDRKGICTSIEKNERYPVEIEFERTSENPGLEIAYFDYNGVPKYGDGTELKLKVLT